MKTTGEVVKSTETKVDVDDHPSSLARHRPSPVVEVVGSVVLVGLWYVFLGLSPVSESTFWPRRGEAWALCLIWAFAVALGLVFERLKMPALAGQLIAGVVARNGRFFTESALTKHWRAQIRAVGLGVIMLRSGLELDMEAIKRAGLVSLRLTLLPGLSEAIAVGIVSSYLYQMPLILGWALGFILAAVSPAVVVVGMFELQNLGYGVAEGIPSVVVAAASMDDIAAMVGFSVTMGLAAGKGTIVENALEGPASVLAGVAYGAAAGVVCGSSFWTSRERLTAITLALGLVPMVIAEMLHSHSGGALGALFTGVVAARRWSKVEPHAAHVVEADLGFFWNAVAQPLLFGAIGSELNFHRITSAQAARAVLVVVVGVCVRVPVAYFATSGSSMARQERAFVALSWIPKATVQAALASVPLEVLDSESRGQQILATAVLAILLTAPIGSAVIKILGPRWLRRDAPEDPEARPSAVLERPSFASRDFTAHIAQIKDAVDFLAVHPFDDVAEAQSSDFRRVIANLNRSVEFVDDKFIHLCNQPVPRVEKRLDIAGNFFKLQQMPPQAIQRSMSAPVDD